MIAFFAIAAALMYLVAIGWIAILLEKNQALEEAVTALENKLEAEYKIGLDRMVAAYSVISKMHEDNENRESARNINEFLRDIEGA